MAFEKGHAKFGGRKAGVRDKKEVARDQVAAHALQVAGLAPEEVEAMTPIAIMQLVMLARWKAGDLGNALIAAEALAPVFTPD